MSKSIVIETERLLLRPFRSSDTDSILAYRGDPEVARFQLWEPFTHNKVKLFIHKYKSITFGSDGHWSGLVVQDKAKGHVLGDVALNISKDDHPQARIGYNIAKKWQRRGYGSEAVRAMVDWVFKNTKVHRITATCDCDNKASAALLKKLGFRREAHFIQNTWSKGQWTDEYVFAMLKKDWK